MQFWKKNLTVANLSCIALAAFSLESCKLQVEIHALIYNLWFPVAVVKFCLYPPPSLSIGPCLREPALPARISERCKAKPWPASHPHCLSEPHFGPLGLHPSPQDCAQQSHWEDQMSLLPNWRSSEAALGEQFQLRGWSQDLFCCVKSVTLFHLPWAAGDQQHVPNTALSPRVKWEQYWGSCAASRPQCKFGSVWHYIRKDTAQLRDLGLLTGAGLRERPLGEWNQAWCWGQLYVQGHSPPGHLPHWDTEFIREVYIATKGINPGDLSWYIGKLVQ